MSDTHGLDDAYSLETPDDNRRLYRSWASTYESDFMVNHGYVYPARVVAVFAARATPDDQPVLDVGCGTGVGAVDLAAAVNERWVVDGLDISPEMLGVAGEKADDEGPLYRSLIEADLTTSLDIGDAEYGSVMSAGTFTHGHVGPEAVAELIRIIRPGGLLCLGINSEHYGSRGFDRMFEAHAEAGRIEPHELEQIDMYDAPSGAHEHADDTALVAVARVR